MAFKDEKIDVHLHSGEWNAVCPRTSAQAIQEDMDLVHVRCGIISSAIALRADVAAGNREVSEIVGNSTRFFGYIYLDPFHPSASMDDLLRYAENRCFVGVKTRPDYHHTSLTAAAYQPLLKKAQEFDLPLLCHDVDALDVARKYPELRIIIAHSGQEKTIRFQACPNVFFCIASSWASPETQNVREMVKLAGEERILFGSDGPIIHPAWTIGKFESSNLNQDALTKIYYYNALNVFPRLRSALP